MIVWAIAVWQPIASIVTMQPLSIKQVEQGGHRRDFVALLIHRDLTEDEPIGARPGADHVDRRLARTPVMRAAHRLAVAGDHRPVGHARRSDCTQARKQRWNWSGSRAAKTRPKVSWEGMPLGRSRKVSNHSRLALPNCLHRHPLVGAADDRAQGDGQDGRAGDARLVCSTRGSVRVAKCSVIVEPGDAAMTSLRAMRDLPITHPTGELPIQGRR